jgi:hypothetical protein
LSKLCIAQQVYCNNIIMNCNNADQNHMGSYTQSSPDLVIPIYIPYVKIETFSDQIIFNDNFGYQTCSLQRSFPVHASFIYVCHYWVKNLFQSKQRKISELHLIQAFPSTVMSFRLPLLACSAWRRLIV